MNPLDQRIAIAESVGRKWTAEDTQCSGCTSWHEYVDRWGIEMLDGDIPDYLNDLNAMHEAINNLPNEVMNNYLDNLCILTNGECANMDGSYHELRNMQRATAAQRAEAYLRTIGKWKD